MINNNKIARTTTSKQQRHQTNRNIKVTMTSNEQNHGRHNDNNKAKFSFKTRIMATGMTMMKQH